MKKKLLLTTIVIILIGASFLVGIEYQKTRTVSTLSGYRGSGVGGSLVGRFGGSMKSAVIGNILTSDSNSITIQMRSGSTQIIFLTNTTPIIKSVRATLSDLSIGTPISVIGSANADGSITAQSIQIRMATSSTQQ